MTRVQYAVNGLALLAIAVGLAVQHTQPSLRKVTPMANRIDHTAEAHKVLEMPIVPQLFWGVLVVCAAVIVITECIPRWLLTAWWLSVVVFLSTAGIIASIAMHLRSYGCDIAYVTAWTNPFGRFPQILAASALAVLVTGVALCIRKHGRKAS